jgi:hypothetical protein
MAQPKAHHIELVDFDDGVTVYICAENGQALALVSDFTLDEGQVEMALNHAREIAGALGFPLYRRTDGSDHFLTLPAGQ